MHCVINVCPITIYRTSLSQTTSKRFFHLPSLVFPFYNSGFLCGVLLILTKLLHCVTVASGCQLPPQIDHGYYVLETTREEDPEVRVSVGQRAHYNCNLGFTLTGPASLQCLDSGEWSPRLPPHCTPTASGKTFKSYFL